MTESSLIDALAQLAGPLFGAGLGSYFGLKSALNGIKQTTRDTLREVQEHRRDTARYVADIRMSVDRGHDDGR